MEQLGGPPTTAIGFALGIERLVLLLAQNKLALPNSAPHVYLLTMGDQAMQQGFRLAESLRNDLPQLRILVHCGGGSFKSQFKRADKSGAQIALILGETEIEQQQITIKYLRNEQSQISVALTKLADYLQPLV